MELLSSKQRFFIVLFSCFFILFSFYIQNTDFASPIFWMLGFGMFLFSILTIITGITANDIEELYDSISEFLHGEKSASPNETSWNK